VVTFAGTLSKNKPLFWIRDTSLLVYVDALDPMSYQAPVPKYAREVIKP
jgi:hypothetical protein